MLIGLLLTSFEYLMQANKNVKDHQNFHASHLKAAVLFALLLTMKHLFLTLAPFYSAYLFQHYCLQKAPTLFLSQDNQKAIVHLPTLPSSTHGILSPLELILPLPYWLRFYHFCLNCSLNCFHLVEALYTTIGQSMYGLSTALWTKLQA